MRKKSETAVIAKVRNMTVIVERQDAEYLSHPGEWIPQGYEVYVMGPEDRRVERMRYPNLGTRSAHFMYRSKDFVVPKSRQGGPDDAAFNAAYHRFRLISREIDMGAKAL